LSLSDQTEETKLSQSFDDRERATRELLRSTLPSRVQLVVASKGPDPEIRWRAKEILEQSEQHGEDVFYAVMEVIQGHKIKGLVGPILSAMPYFDKPHLQQAAQRSLRAVAEPRDLPVLEVGLLSESESVKIASIQGIAVASAADATKPIRPLLADSNEIVRLAANRVFADMGDRSCFSGLLSLLESEEVATRTRSISILRLLTGQRFGYVAYDTAEKRAVAIAAWKTWLDREGQTAKLLFPLAKTRPFLGRFMVCNYSENFVTEYNAKGEAIWKKENLDHPWGLDVLSNGHRLVASCNGNYVVEFDSSGTEVWRKDGLPGYPLSVQRLDNGNTLVSTGSIGKVLEIAPDGTIVWETGLDGFVADACRLPDGLTLVVNYKSGEVVEVDREGKIVWRIGGFKNTRSAQRLENGNTLVCDAGANRVVECDRGGEIVWKFEGLNTTYDCQRLPDGNTVIGDASGLRLVDPAGKSLWHRPMKTTGRILAY